MLAKSKKRQQNMDRFFLFFFKHVRKQQVSITEVAHRTTKSKMFPSSCTQESWEAGVLIEVDAEVDGAGSSTPWGATAQGARWRGEADGAGMMREVILYEGGYDLIV